MNIGSRNKYRHLLLSGVSAIAISTSVATAQEADQEGDQSQAGVDTVVVMATKRSQNVQDIASTVQAISGSDISEMGAQNAEDYMRFIPAVSFVSSTPGANDVIFRGITIGLGSYIGQAGASVYLDEASLTSTGSQPDVRMIDIASVEALSGPQGTLYGDSAQAGILRITPNKPVMNEFEAIVEGGMRKGAKSDFSYDVNAIFNIPVVEDKLAIRVVAEKAKDGGFIDNVLGHTPDGNSGNYYYTLYQYPDWGTVDNSHVVEDRWNDVDYLTARASAKLNLNEDWSATFSFAHQKNETNADNSFNPFVGDLQTVAFNQNFREDKFNLYAFVVEGDLGWAQLLSSTSFYKRNIRDRYDTTVYSKYYATWGCYVLYNDPVNYSAYAPQYCLGPEPGSDVLTASSYPTQQDKFAQEIRLSGTTGAFDWLIGAYYERSNHDWDGYFAAPTNFNYQNSLSLQYFENDLYPGETFPNAISPWGSSDYADWEQIAAFGEATWHITDDLHLTAGTRLFERSNSSVYTALQPNTRAGDDFQAGTPNTGKNFEVVPKVSLAYDLTDENMIYGLFTTGYRPGGTNRSRGDINRLVFPTVYGGDKITNYEFGSKNRFMDNQLQLNMTYYYMKWDDYQLQVVDPSFQPCEVGVEEVFCGQPWQSVVANSPGGAHTEGIEVDAIFAPTDGFTIGGNLTHLTAKTDGAFPEAGIGANVDLPNVPEWKGSVWASYFWPVEFVSGGEMFIRAQYTYQSETNNRLVESPVNDSSLTPANPILVNDAYGITDLSAGILAHDDGWELSFYVKNLTDTRAQYQNATGLFEYPFSSSGVMGGAPYDHYQRVYTNRPREFGMRLKWLFSG